MSPAEMERTIVIVASSDPQVMKDVSDLARGRGCATMLMTDVAVLDPAKNAKIPRFDLTYFDNKSDRTRRSADLAELIGLGTPGTLLV